MEQQLILDRYRPLEELAEGGFASVTLAWDTRMQRRVAIKRLDLPLDERGEATSPAGLAEARTSAMLSHPAIVTVFDFDTDSDEAFLIMEYVDGAPLSEMLDNLGGPLTLDETAAVAAAVASALEFAHDNGVLHLDIKPENVLIAQDGRVKVADFGMAGLSSLAGHGPAFGGTPGYMPLEQLEGEHVSERTDEWAFAVLVYEMLTGDNPFADATIAESVVRMEVFDPPLLTAYEPGLPPALDDVVLAALGVRPSERYASVADFAAALLPHLGDPSAGTASLRELVSAYADDELDTEETGRRLGLWDRLAGPVGVTLARAIGAAQAGWLAWAGLTPIGLDATALTAAIALVAVAAVFSPSLGIGLGLACFVAGLFAAGAWMVALPVALLGIAWWWLIARRDVRAALLPLSAPVFGMAWIPFAEPLLAGFALSPLAAAASGLLGGCLAMLSSAASGGDVPYVSVAAPYLLDVWQTALSTRNVIALVADPSAYVALAGWPLAALLASLPSRRATRSAAAVGAMVGAGTLVAAYAVADIAAGAVGREHGWLTPVFGASLAGSLILVLLVATMGAPLRPEE